MAAVSVGAARARQRLRDDAWMLRGHVQQSLRPATAGKKRPDAAIATSPWSRLEWVREDDALNRVLVPLD